MQRSLALPVLLLLAACSRETPIPEEPSPLPVRIETVERAELRPALVLLGTVRPAGEAEVTVPVPGRLRYPGRFREGLSSGLAVAAGEILVQVEDLDAEAALAEASLRLEAARSELARYQKAFDAGLVSAAQLAPYKVEAELAAQRLAASRQRRSSLDLRSPVAGRLLVDRRLPPGSTVQAGTVLARVAAGGAPRVEARAAAADRGRLREGLGARFVVPGSPGVAGRGAIREISPVVEAGGTVLVVAEVTGGTDLPAPGEGVEVHVELDARPAALSVPEEALLTSEGGDAVFVLQAGAARRRSLTTGARGGGRVEVLRGLSPGDRVVVEGASLLSEGDRVTPVQDEEDAGR